MNTRFVPFELEYLKLMFNHWYKYKHIFNIDISIYQTQEFIFDDFPSSSTSHSLAVLFIQRNFNSHLLNLKRKKIGPRVSSVGARLMFADSFSNETYCTTTDRLNKYNIDQLISAGARLMFAISFSNEFYCTATNRLNTYHIDQRATTVGFLHTNAAN